MKFTKAMLRSKTRVFIGTKTQLLCVSYILIYLFGCKNKAQFVTLYETNGDDTLKKAGIIFAGKKEGIWKTYDQVGNLISIDSFQSGLLNGKSITLYENGKLYIECNYSTDTLDGDYSMYYENGKLNFKKFYSKGKSDGSFKLWYEDGGLRQIGEYKGGMRVGIWRIYHNNGKLERIEEYNELGVEDGEWFVFSEVGDTIEKRIYKQGVMKSTSKP